MTKLQTIQMNSAAKAKLINHLPQLKGIPVMIVGDVGVDEYVMGEVRRISPEAPVPVVEVESEDQRLGLAANVAQNIKSLGGDPILVSVIGRDGGARMLRELFSQNQVSENYLVIDDKRPTTRKTRVMAKHHHVVRVDYELRRYLSESVEAQVFKNVEANIDRVSCVILEDYAKGVVSKNLVQKISTLCLQKKKRLLVDPHRHNPGEFYQGVNLLKPNYDEAVALAGMNFEDLKENPNKVYEVGQALKKITGAKELVMTRGQHGMTIFDGAEIFEVPTYARKVFDVTGAGDTVIAALALGLSSGLSLVESSQLANFAAGVVVGKVGCVPCEIPELTQYIETTV